MILWQYGKIGLTTQHGVSVSTEIKLKSTNLIIYIYTPDSDLPSEYLTRPAIKSTDDHGILILSEAKPEMINSLGLTRLQREAICA